MPSRSPLPPDGDGIRAAHGLGEHQRHVFQDLVAGRVARGVGFPQEFRRARPIPDTPMDLLFPPGGPAHDGKWATKRSPLARAALLLAH